GPAGDGGLVLAGHIDTVPYDAGRWTSDPFTLTERNGALYGLGTADMKGFFPIVIEALRDIDARTLTAPLWIVATADEESTMAGVKTLVASGKPRARHALIGEPTNLKPVRAHKGILMEAITLTGRSGHSSDPSLGINALDAMHEVMGELLRWREQLKSRFRDDTFAVPHPTLNLGCIHGGDSPNRICALCELHIDLRLMPGMLPDAMREEIDRLIRPVAERHRVQLDIAPLFSGTPALATRADAPIVRAVELLTGETAGSVAFGTEGPFLADLGIETVILGPGDIACAHQPDEHLRLDRIAPTVSLLQKLVQRFCTGGQADRD
ncbi:MAG: acetylornithine deacetylase, partial [Actinomycetota bacterium]|nr:acetylornithine deacetylase [Actinomycetota bacterium]